MEKGIPSNGNFKKQYIFFLEYVSWGKGSKSKTKQMGLYQPKKILHSEGNYQQNETAAYWMGEDIYKQYIQYIFNI